MSEDLSVWDTVAPSDSQGMSQAAHVERVELFFLFSRLEQRVRDSLPDSSVVRTQALYTAISVWVVSLLLSHTHFVSLARVWDIRPIRL